MEGRKGVKERKRREAVGHETKGLFSIMQFLKRSEKVESKREEI